MTINQFKEMMMFNEPDFQYRGQDYSICSPNGKYYVTASDNPDDINLEFDTLDDLLNDWMIQGHKLRDIISDIDFS